MFFGSCWRQRFQVHEDVRQYFILELCHFTFHSWFCDLSQIMFCIYSMGQDSRFLFCFALQVAVHADHLLTGSSSTLQGFLSVSVVKNPLAKAGDAGDLSLIPGAGISSGEGNGNPLQYSCLENSTGRRAWKSIAYGVAKS